MSDHVYKSVEVTGSSSESIDDAIRTAVVKASESLRHLDWFELVAVRGHLPDGQVSHFQVTIKIGFRLESRDALLAVRRDHRAARQRALGAHAVVGVGGPVEREVLDVRGIRPVRARSRTSASSIALPQYG